MDRFFGANLNLGVIGLGKLGSPMVACFASKGFDVVGCDLDPKKVQAINERRAPVDETDLGDLLAANKGCIRATESIGEAVRASDVTFVVTATPSLPDGRFSLEYILPVCEQIGYALRTKSKQAFHVVVITSTVMPGDTWGAIRETLEKASGKRAGEQFGLCYNPEFIALGSVIRDFLNPDFVLLGASDPLTDARVSSIYKTFTDAPIASMSPTNAEITKISVNTFLCMKITYGNMLQRVCHKIVGADCDVVSQAVGLDSRIGKKLLKGGISYGGPCLPRDTKAFATLGDTLPLTIHEKNLQHHDWIIDTVRNTYNGGSVTILGTSYKVGTSLTEESFGLRLAMFLTALDYPLHVDDFEFWKQTKQVVLMLPDPKYKELDYSGKTVIDPWRFLPELANDPTVNYIPLGIGPRE